MNKKIALLLLLILPFALCACGDDAPSAEGLILTTGNETGTYYGFGSLLAQKVSSATTTFVAVVPSEGSRANIQALARNEAQLALTQYDAMLYAREGNHTFQVNGPNTGFSVVAVLYPEAVHIVTLDPSIKTVADLAGKRVSVGAAGSGIYTNAMDILAAYGLTEKDIVSSYHPHSEAAGHPLRVSVPKPLRALYEAVRDGKTEAAHGGGGPPDRLPPVRRPARIYSLNPYSACPA